MNRLPKTQSPLAPRSSTDALCRDLIDGMHAASQPLTILRASLGSPDVARQPIKELRKLVRRSSQEVERLCILFNYLQQFVTVESIEAEREIQELPGLLRHAIEGVDVLFAEAGIALTCQQSKEPSPLVLVDSCRLEQALSGILLVVLGRAGRGDEVAVSTSTEDASVKIMVDATLADAAALVAETRLSMALAVANMHSQSAHMTWTHQPFAVQITLPVANTHKSA